MFADHCSTRAGAAGKPLLVSSVLVIGKLLRQWGGGGKFLPGRRSSKLARFAIDCDFFVGKGTLKNQRFAHERFKTKS